MCGRFYIDPDDMSDEELIALLNREKARAEEHNEALRLGRGEIRPGDCAAVIAMNRKLQRSAFVLRWGFRTNKRLIINAHSETASEKPMFQQSLQLRRCLIPASAYFEWDHRDKPLQKYRFNVAQKKLFYLGGLYRFEESTPLPTFTILTREATQDIACFHDRMPVIIPNELADAWLDHEQSADYLLQSAVTDISWERAI